MSALLITTPQVDFNHFLAAGHKMTGRSFAMAADKAARSMCDVEKFLSCLSVMEGGQGQAFSPQFLPFVSLTVLVWGDERDLLDVLAICGMKFIVFDTVTRGIQGAVVTGNLSQWRDAVIGGLQEHQQSGVQEVFRHIQMRFEQHGLGLWQGIKKTSDGLFIEDQR